MTHPAILKGATHLVGAAGGEAPPVALNAIVGFSAVTAQFPRSPDADVAAPFTIRRSGRVETACSVTVRVRPTQNLPCPPDFFPGGAYPADRVLSFTPGQTEITFSVILSAGNGGTRDLFFGVVLMTPVGCILDAVNKETFPRVLKADLTAGDAVVAMALGFEDVTIDPDTALTKQVTVTRSGNAAVACNVTVLFGVADGEVGPSFPGSGFVGGAYPQEILSFTGGEASKALSFQLAAGPGPAVEQFVKVQLVSPVGCKIDSSQQVDHFKVNKKPIVVTSPELYSPLKVGWNIRGTGSAGQRSLWLEDGLQTGPGGALVATTPRPGFELHGGNLNEGGFNIGAFCKTVMPDDFEISFRYTPLADATSDDNTGEWTFIVPRIIGIGSFPANVSAWSTAQFGDFDDQNFRVNARGYRTTFDNDTTATSTAKQARTRLYDGSEAPGTLLTSTPEPPSFPLDRTKAYDIVYRKLGRQATISAKVVGGTATIGPISWLSDGIRDLGLNGRMALIAYRGRGFRVEETPGKKFVTDLGEGTVTPTGYALGPDYAVNWKKFFRAPTGIVSGTNPATPVPVAPPWGQPRFLRDPVDWEDGITLRQAWYYPLGADIAEQPCAHVAGDVPGYITHCGIDYAKLVGGLHQTFKVYAAAAGIVTYVVDLPDHCNITIRHDVDGPEGQRYTTYYGHLDPTLFHVPNGASVAKGQHIAWAGSTGTDNLHLHFEFRIGASGAASILTRIDPYDIADGLIRQGIPPLKEHYPNNATSNPTVKPLGPRTAWDYAPSGIEPAAVEQLSPRLGVKLGGGAKAGTLNNAIALMSRAVWNGDWRVTFRTKRLDTNNPDTTTTQLLMMFLFGIRGKGTAASPLLMKDWPSDTDAFTHTWRDNCFGGRITFYNQQTSNTDLASEQVYLATYNATTTAKTVAPTAVRNYNQSLNTEHFWTVTRIDNKITVQKSGDANVTEFVDDTIRSVGSGGSFGLMTTGGVEVEAWEFTVITPTAGGGGDGDGDGDGDGGGGTGGTAYPVYRTANISGKTAWNIGSASDWSSFFNSADFSTRYGNMTADIGVPADISRGGSRAHPAAVVGNRRNISGGGGFSIRTSNVILQDIDFRGVEASDTPIIDQVGPSYLNNWVIGCSFTNGNTHVRMHTTDFHLNFCDLYPNPTDNGDKANGVLRLFGGRGANKTTNCHVYCCYEDDSQWTTGNQGINENFYAEPGQADPSDDSEIGAYPQNCDGTVFERCFMDIAFWGGFYLKHGLKVKDTVLVGGCYWNMMTFRGNNATTGVVESSSFKSTKPNANVEIQCGPTVWDWSRTDKPLRLAARSHYITPQAIDRKHIEGAHRSRIYGGGGAPIYLGTLRLTNGNWGMGPDSASNPAALHDVRIEGWDGEVFICTSGESGGLRRAETNSSGLVTNGGSRVGANVFVLPTTSRPRKTVPNLNKSNTGIRVAGRVYGT